MIAARIFNPLAMTEKTTLTQAQAPLAMTEIFRLRLNMTIKKWILGLKSKV